MFFIPSAYDVCEDKANKFILFLGAANISIFPQQRRLDVLGEGFRSRRFQIEKGSDKKSQPVKSERCLC